MKPEVKKRGAMKRVWLVALTALVGLSRRLQIRA